MDTTIDKIENSEALIKIKLKEEDYQPGVTQKIKEYSKKANIKGFRPGKVPTGVVQKMYGTSILLEEVNQVLSKELNKILRDNSIQFLGEPIPTEDQESIDWETQKEFEFVYNIGYADDFELKIDKKLKVEFAKIKIDKKVMDETIQNLQKQFGELNNPEEVGAEDTIFGSLKSGNSEIDQEVSLDVAEFKKPKSLIGLKIDSPVAIDAKKNFTDATYFQRVTRLSDEDLKASKYKFDFVIKGINRTEPAEVNQELFDKTFGKDAVKTREEFDEKVKEAVAKNYLKEAEHFFDHRVREKLLEKLKIKLPEKFLKRWLLKTNENITEDMLVEEFESYSKELKWSLIRNKIFRENELKVENEEVVDEAKKVIASQFGGIEMAAQLGDQLDTFADNYLKAEDGNNYMKIYNQVQNVKVTEYVKSQITIKEKEVSLNDFRKLT